MCLMTTIWGLFEQSRVFDTHTHTHAHTLEEEEKAAHPSRRGVCHGWAQLQYRIGLS